MVRINLSDGQRAAAAAPAVAVSPPDETVESVLSNEIMCPLTGELIARDDVDGLIDMYERLKKTGDMVYAVQIEIRNTLYSQTEGDAATRRIQGRRRAAKIELSAVSFEQSVLKELWNSHEKYAMQHMRIESLAVQMAAFKKLVNTSSSEPDFVFFRDSLTKACRGRVGTPSLKIEK